MNIDGHTKMYCLIGSPVGHSGSPAMYNYSFDRLGINSAYLAYDVPLIIFTKPAVSPQPLPGRTRSCMLSSRRTTLA